MIASLDRKRGEETIVHTMGAEKKDVSLDKNKAKAPKMRKISIFSLMWSEMSQNSKFNPVCKMRESHFLLNFKLKKAQIIIKLKKFKEMWICDFDR